MKIGSNVRIRAIEREDLPQVAGWLNDPVVNQHIATAAMVSLAAEQKWFDAVIASHTDQVFMIDRHDPVGGDTSPWDVIGGAGLHRISASHGSASLGIYIGEPSLWGKGLGTEATALVLDYAFGERRLHRVELEVFTDNPRALSSYRKLGFSEEGIKREAFFRHGAFKDVVAMSLLAPEWLERRDVLNHVFLDENA